MTLLRLLYCLLFKAHAEPKRVRQVIHTLYPLSVRPLRAVVAAAAAVAAVGQQLLQWH
jgi:hypothetical protein